MKRILLLLIFLSLIISNITLATEKTQVKVVTWWLADFANYMQRMKKEYEAKNPNIEIVLENINTDNMDQFLTTQTAAKNAPDLVNLNNDTAFCYYQKGLLEPLDKYLTPTDVNEYWDTLRNKTLFDGKHDYAFPWYASAEVLYLNEMIFKKSGLNINVPPKTWEEVYIYSKIIKSKTGLYGFSTDWRGIGWVETLRVGENLFKEDLSTVAFNTPKVVARLEYFHKLYKEKLIPSDFPDYLATMKLFDHDRVGIMLLAVAMYKHMTEEVPNLKCRIVSCPMSPNSANRFFVGMMNFVLLKSSRVKPEAVQFAKFITGHYAQIEFCKSASIIPSTKIGLETDSYFTKSADIAIQAQLLASRSMKYADDTFTTKLPKNCEEISKIIDSNSRAAIRGEKTVSEALKNAEEKSNLYLMSGK